MSQVELKNYSIFVFVLKKDFKLHWRSPLESHELHRQAHQDPERPVLIDNSAPFFTSYHGYKIRVREYPNMTVLERSVKSGPAFFAVMGGDYDTHL